MTDTTRGERYYATPIEAECVDHIPFKGGSLLNERDERERNRIRAEFAAIAVQRYAARVGGGHGEPLETVIGDLLTDLRHLCDALNKSGSMEDTFNGLLDSSERRYTEEIEGQE